MTNSVTITRHADGCVLTYPFFWGAMAAYVGGYKQMVPCPTFEEEDAEEMLSFADFDVAEHVVELFVDGGGITSYDGNDVSWVLSFEEV